MIYTTSAVAVIIPLFIFLFVIKRIDRYKNEPVGIILKNFFYGASGAIFLVILFGFIINKLFFLLARNINAEQYEAIFIAPLLEESTKALILIIIMVNKKTGFITDGLIFGGAIGLGFSTVENFLYFITYGSSIHEWINLVIIRTLFAAVMHSVSTAIFGAFFIFSRYKGGISSVIYSTAGFILAFVVHCIWNLSVNFDSAFLAGILSMVIIVSVFVLVFLFSVNNENKIIYSELAEEVIKGTIPPDHLLILVSPQRYREGWIDEERRKYYVKAAITLAFRKMQLKNSRGSKRNYFEKDIEFYRDLISGMLKNNVPNE